MALAIGGVVELNHHTANFADIYNNLGLSLAALGNRDEAQCDYEKAIRIDSSSPKPYLNLGNLLRQDDPARARQCYEKAIVLCPDYAEAYNNLGVLLAKTDPEAAMRCYRASLAIVPNNPGAHSNLGGILQQRGDLAGAIVEYERALEIDPQLITARKNLALARKMQMVLSPDPRCLTHF